MGDSGGIRVLLLLKPGSRRFVYYICGGGADENFTSYCAVAALIGAHLTGIAQAQSFRTRRPESRRRSY